MNRPILRIWAVPIILASAILSGLLLALLGSASLHWLAWSLLAMPLVTVLRFLSRIRSASSASKSASLK